MGATTASLGIALGIGCSGGQSAGPRGAARTIRVTPDSSAVAIGGTVALSATARDAAGNPVAAPGFFWSSSDTTIAAVAQSGMVTARQTGSAQIAASADGVSGVAMVVVVPQAVGSVIVAPSSATLRVNTTLQLTDTVKDASGHALEGRAVTWSTDNSAVATVDAAGLVVARAVGTAHIVASSDGQTGTSTITVTLVPVATVVIMPHDPTVFVQQTVQLTAQLADSVGNPLAGRPITWKSLATSVATVSASGLVTGVAPGKAVIEATSEAKTGRDTVTVSAVPIASVTVAPKSVTLQNGQQQQFTATVRDQAGNLVTDQPVAWMSTNQSVATVSTSGLASAVGVGQASIVAQAGGKADTASVTVVPVPVATVTITPNPDTVPINGTVTLTATPRDVSGNVLTGRTATWASGDGSIATVDQQGVVRGVNLGSTTVTATVDGIAGSGTVIVTPGPVDHIVVTPNPAKVKVGDTQQLMAKAFDATNHDIPNAIFTWSSTHPEIASVDASGLVSGISTGRDTVIAQSGGVTGTTEVNVHGVLGASEPVAPSDASGSAWPRAVARATPPPSRRPAGSAPADLVSR